MNIMNMVKLPSGCGDFLRKSVCFWLSGYAGLFFMFILLHDVHKLAASPDFRLITLFSMVWNNNSMNIMKKYEAGVIKEIFRKRSLYRGGKAARI